MEVIPLLDMATRKVQINLRLDAEILERVDEAIQKAYANLPGIPSRNAVLEQWIQDGLAALEIQAKQISKGKP